MNSVPNTSTSVGVGYATHSDAFQCGREAAQIAKNQIPSGTANLVFVFARADYHFKDFVEGVRLVLGEEALVGIPSTHIITNETSAQNSCFVVAVQSHLTRFVLMSDNNEDSSLIQSTTLVSQFRKSRGNFVRDVQDHGVILFTHNSIHEDELGRALGADAGVGTWLLGAATSASENSFLVCQGNNLQKGMIGIECLSQEPWGLGSVDVGSFPNQKDIVSQAVKTALREAASQLKSKTAAVGLLFFDRTSDTSFDFNPTLLKEAASVLPRVPLFGFLTQKHFVRRPERAMTTHHDAVVALLIPA